MKSKPTRALTMSEWTDGALSLESIEPGTWTRTARGRAQPRTRRLKWSALERALGPEPPGRPIRSGPCVAAGFYTLGQEGIEF